MLRYIQPFIEKDLEQKMVFIGGPRQVGKTTLSHSLGQKYASYLYLTWDSLEDRKGILKAHWKQTTPLIIFDELHKFPKWKNWIKGIYDTKPNNQQYLVTGSARLDVYKRGGDSLMGRYHYWRLHPLTIDEYVPGLNPHEIYERLLRIGGFPESFLQNDEREARRWRRERFDKIIREDIQDLEPIRHTQLLQLFVEALRTRVGSTVTLSNLAADLQISSKTAKAWLTLIETMYIGFPIYPLTTNLPRAIQKPPKFYFYDIADAQDELGVRLENLVAVHLLKKLHFLEDYHGHHCELRYIRDKDGREVDFVTLIDGKITDLIEVKPSSTDISQNLKYYSNKLNPVNTIQIVGDLKRSFDKDNIKVLHPVEYFQNPPWEIF